MRLERDALGELPVPDTAYYGVQTERARQNFAVSGHTVDELPVFIQSIAAIKKAAALANRDAGLLAEDVCQAICRAADEILRGDMRGEFPVDLFQGGGSTSTNMNVNEVIANRSNEILTGDRGAGRVHPNTHVNMGQSTNDVIPAAMALACYRYAEALKVSLKKLEVVLKRKAEEFRGVVKASRTCLQDAVPITLGQEFGAYHALVKRHADLLEQISPMGKLELPLGATASGTGLGAHPGYLAEVYRRLSDIANIEIAPRENLFDALQSADGYVRMSAYLKSLATGLGKFARDLRLMSSGPRAGLGEIVLPAVQPGSSIMPGKVNPVMPELINQICYQVVGNDAAVTMAAEGGELDLNVWEPVIIKNLTESFTILTEGIALFSSLCIERIEANAPVCLRYAEDTLANATVVSAIFGYEIGSKVAKAAHASGKSVKEAALELGVLTPEEADRLFDPLALADVKRSGELIASRKAAK